MTNVESVVASSSAWIIQICYYCIVDICMLHQRSKKWCVNFNFLH